MNQFKKGYEHVLNNTGGLVGSVDTSVYISKVEIAIDNAVDALRAEAAHRNNVNEDYLKGWLAEQWHAETLKISGHARGRKGMYRKVCKWLKLGTGLQSEWQAG
jgi:hypothetical protein